MSMRKIPFVEEEYYHLYNRGNAKRTIFKDESDYQRFLQLLYVCNTSAHVNIRDLPKDFVPTEPIVAIGAYTLMPNHFHLLIKQTKPGGLSQFMQKIGTSYSSYFNKKYNMTGSLFEGKFKAQHLETDRYLRYMYAYIHLNPVKLIEPSWKEKGLKNKTRCFEFLDAYIYSSYRTYINAPVPKNQAHIIDPSAFPTYFATAAAHKKELLSWLHHNP